VRHRSQLFGFIFSIVQNIPDAEDVFQQTSLALWSNFARLRPESDFLNWACKVAKNKAIDFLRTRRREQNCFSEALLEQIADQQTTREADEGSRAEALTQCVEKLSQRDRDLVSRCYGRDASIKIVADEMGRPVGSIYVSLTRVRRILYKCVRRALAREEFA
jgi:RNA polymerase sigma-70 factor (ECF subfamily)